MAAAAAGVPAAHPNPHRPVVDRWDAEGWTLFTRACFENNVIRMNHLVFGRNANPNAANKDGFTAMHLACQNGNFHIVRCLVKDMKADVNPLDLDGRTPLFLAIGNGHADIVKWLIVEAKARTETIMLHALPSIHHFEIMQILLDHVEDVPIKNPRISNSEGFTALHSACWYPNVSPDIIRLLISRNPRHVHLRSLNNGWTPLHCAAYSENKLAIELLLKAGSDPNVLDVQKCTPLTVACIKQKYLSIVALSPTYQHVEDAVEPMDVACQVGNLRHIRWLLHNIPMELTSEHVKHTCVSGNLPALQWMMETYPALRSDASEYMMCACNGGQFDILSWILDPKNGLEVDVNGTTDDNGNTVLHTACMYDLVHVVVYLVHIAGADITVQNQQGQTPADLAESPELTRFFNDLAAAREASAAAAPPAREQEPPDAPNMTCCVCLDAIKTCVLVPCNHLAACKECSDAVQTCPICRAPVEHRLNIFL